MIYFVPEKFKLNAKKYEFQVYASRYFFTCPADYWLGKFTCPYKIRHNMIMSN
jgi:hypothetical protein